MITGLKLIGVADLVGTGVFAVQGALVAAIASLDWLGVLVVAFVTALGGGMVRDVLLGVAPPAALRDGRYPFVCSPRRRLCSRRAGRRRALADGGS